MRFRGPAALNDRVENAGLKCQFHGFRGPQAIYDRHPKAGVWCAGQRPDKFCRPYKALNVMPVVKAGITTMVRAV